MSITKPKCYVAGPFFNPAQKQNYLDTVAIVEKHCKAYSVLRDGIFCPPNADLETQQKAFDINANKIEECDFMVAILDFMGVDLNLFLPHDPSKKLDGDREVDISDDLDHTDWRLSRKIALPDTGTVWEMGAAYIAGKPVIGLMISDQKVNLMLARGTVALARSPDQLEKVLAKLVPVLLDETKLPEVIVELKSMAWKSEIV